MFESVVTIIVLATGCFIGIIFSALSLNKLYKKGFLVGNSFGIICAADVIILYGFMASYSLSTILAIQFYDSIVYILGFLTFFFTSTTMLIQILKALNRLCAILLYWKYSTIFSIKNTFVYIAVLLIINILLILPYIDDECHLYYIVEYYYWILKTPKCMTLYNICTKFNLTFLPIAVFLNILSSSYLFFKRKNILQQQKLSKTEKNFLIQTCITSANMIFFVFFFNTLRSFFGSTEFTLFLFNCFGTLLFYALNEIIIFASLRDLKIITTKNSSQIKMTNILPKGITRHM